MQFNNGCLDPNCLSIVELNDIECCETKYMVFLLIGMFVNVPVFGFWFWSVDDVLRIHRWMPLLQMVEIGFAANGVTFPAEHFAFGILAIAIPRRVVPETEHFVLFGEMRQNVHRTAMTTKLIDVPLLILVRTDHPLNGV